MRWSLEPLGGAIKKDGGILQTGPFGSQLKQAEYSPEGIPVIMPKDIHDGGVLDGSVARVPEATADRLRRHRIRAQGIVLPRRGEVTKRAFIRPEQEGWLCGTGCIKIEATGKFLWPKFLYYFLGTKGSTDWLEKNAVGSTMLNLSAEIVSRFPIRYPDISTQRSIADILSHYDDLITNNTRGIELLERSARLLFEEWFVRLRYPGHEHDKIVDGVPEGWSRKTLGDIAQTNDESFSNKNLPNEITYIDIASVKEGCILAKTRLTSEEAPGRARRKAKDGDVIWSNVRPNLRQFALVLDPDDLDVFSTGFTILTPTSVPYSFLYVAVTTDAFVAHLVNQTTGSSYPAVRPDDFERAEILVPTNPPLEEFQIYCEPLFRLSHKLGQENEKLAQARDLLLPRLMDGRIEV